jgi:hypothetical protein
MTGTGLTPVFRRTLIGCRLSPIATQAAEPGFLLPEVELMGLSNSHHCFCHQCQPWRANGRININLHCAASFPVFWELLTYRN